MHKFVVWCITLQTDQLQDKWLDVLLFVLSLVQLGLAVGTVKGYCSSLLTFAGQTVLVEITHGYAFSKTFATYLSTKALCDATVGLEVGPHFSCVPLSSQCSCPLRLLTLKTLLWLR